MKSSSVSFWYSFVFVSLSLTLFQVCKIVEKEATINGHVKHFRHLKMIYFFLNFYLICKNLLFLVDMKQFPFIFFQSEKCNITFSYFSFMFFLEFSWLSEGSRRMMHFYWTLFACTVGTKAQVRALWHFPAVFWMSVVHLCRQEGVSCFPTEHGSPWMLQNYCGSEGWGGLGPLGKLCHHRATWSW